MAHCAEGGLSGKVYRFKPRQFPRQGYARNKAAARAVGKLVAERAKAKGITSVVFDRGGYLYHGRVQALAEGAREGGLKF